MNCSLTCYKRPIESPFGLLGDKETALTFALGYTLSKSSELLELMFNRAGFKLTSRELRKKIAIDVERVSNVNEKRPDIIITVKDTCVLIIEGKIKSLPQKSDLPQCKNYIRILLTEQKGIEKKRKKLLYLHEGEEKDRGIWSTQLKKWLKTKTQTNRISESITWEELKIKCHEFWESTGNEYLDYLWHFLDLERYYWIPIRKCITNENLIEKVEKITILFEKFRSRCGLKLQHVAGRPDNEWLLVKTEERNDGWIGYRIGHTDIFGLTLNWGRNPHIKIWIKLPRLNPRQKKYLESICPDKKANNNAEWIFQDALDYSDNQISNLFRDMNRLRLLHTACIQGRE